MRWQDATGAMWDSKFEAQVYEAIFRAGQGGVRRTAKGKAGESDTFSYSMPVRDASCDACGTAKVSKQRTYTPDLYVALSHERDDGSRRLSGFYIEVKGYLRSPQRSLLRAFCKARKDVSLRIVLQRDFKVGAGTAVSWITKYLKIPVTVWTGRLPEEWLK